MQTGCSIDVYVNGGPDAGTAPVYGCVLSSSGTCTVLVGGTVTLETMLAATGGTVRTREALSGAVCDSVWSRP